jgi:hypothetical protein
MTATSAMIIKGRIFFMLMPENLSASMGNFETIKYESNMIMPYQNHWLISTCVTIGKLPVQYINGNDAINSRWQNR